MITISLYTYDNLINSNSAKGVLVWISQALQPVNIEDNSINFCAQAMHFISVEDAVCVVGKIP